MGDLTSWNPSARIPPSHGPCVSRCDGCWGQGVGLEKEPPMVWVALCSQGRTRECAMRREPLEPFSPWKSTWNFSQWL